MVEAGDIQFDEYQRKVIETLQDLYEKTKDYQPTRSYLKTLLSKVCIYYYIK